MKNSGKIKVGIFFNARQEQGGLYHYALTLVDSLEKYIPNLDFVLYWATVENLPLNLRDSNWRLVVLSPNAVRFRMLIEFLLMSLARVGVNIPFRLLVPYKEIRVNPPDVMLYVKPTIHVFQWGFPSIFPIHDLQHRYKREFPEVSASGEFNRREYIYRFSVNCASAILTDSEVGKQDVLASYGGDDNRIFPTPYVAPTFRDELITGDLMKQVHDKYKLPNRYLFYPAAFWAHKNHLRLLLAIAWIAREKNVRIPLVLAGSKHHDFVKISNLATELGLNDIVHFLGYVPDEHMPALYSQAFALVMPTFFGPTNIPVLEAWSMKCPVITSRIRGIDEQVGSAGLLCDPYDEQSLADAIWRLYTDEELRLSLIKRGTDRVSMWKSIDFAHRVEQVIRFAFAYPKRDSSK